MRAVHVAALLSGIVMEAGAAEAGPAPGAEPAAVAGSGAGTAHRAARTPAPLAARVQLLARELDLDPGQQLAVTKLLQEQRAQVAKVWSDPSVASALRVGATQAIADRTAEQIRAILSEEQRERYNKPRQHEAPVGAPGGDVQKWMQSAQGLEQPGLPAVKGD